MTSHDRPGAPYGRELLHIVVAAGGIAGLTAGLQLAGPHVVIEPAHRPRQVITAPDPAGGACDPAVVNQGSPYGGTRDEPSPGAPR
ncbi:hypothetical protein [Streptomyces vilmorinianum]|uniref:hypothetical protein n=1 Tax=Streptomyces vilmorinianum TaxID=3051092 RepID=UPI0010FB228F|nr:hypothetical protein [Streptomyces vilmorinianum]